MKEIKQTTKVCPNCGNEDLLLFSTLDLKTCSDCDTDISWFKEEGQTDLFSFGKVNHTNRE